VKVASGFLGSHIFQALLKKGCDIKTIGRTNDSDIQWNLQLPFPEVPKVEMVVHCAGLAHRVSDKESVNMEFYSVNEFGTQNLCLALESNGNLPDTFVFISTVAVYGKDTGHMIDEHTTPEPKTSYGISKLRAELYLQEWAIKNKVNLLVLRLPLVVGNGVPGNLRAMVNAIRKGYYFRLGGGMARRSMVLATDVADFIASSLNKSGLYNLTDGHNPRYSELEEFIGSSLGRKVRSLPIFFVKLLANLGDYLYFLPINNNRLKKLTSDLTFSNLKARSMVGWNPMQVVGNFDPKSIG